MGKIRTQIEGEKKGESPYPFHKIEYNLEKKITTKSGSTPHLSGRRMIIEELRGFQFDVWTLISLHVGKHEHAQSLQQ